MVGWGWVVFGLQIIFINTKIYINLNALFIHKSLWNPFHKLCAYLVYTKIKRHRITHRVTHLPDYQHIY